MPLMERDGEQEITKRGLNADTGKYQIFERE
jgi:hypothetical protein